MDLMLLGMGLGLAAGISPGPLLTLVVTSTLERGFGAGLRVALAPLLSDTPIILLTVVVLSELPATFLALVGALGGAVVAYFGVRTLLVAAPAVDSEQRAAADHRDLWRGALVNFLNPHPWLFWATVQGPILVQGWRQSPLRGLAFVASFYLAIVGSKATVAWLVARAGGRLSERWSRRLVQGCGALLVTLGVVLVLQAALRLR